MIISVGMSECPILRISHVLFSYFSGRLYLIIEERTDFLLKTQTMSSPVPYQRKQSGFAGLLLERDDSRNENELILSSSFESSSGSQSHQSHRDFKFGEKCSESEDSNMMRGLSLDEDDTENTIFYGSSCISSRLEAGKERWICQSPTEFNTCCGLEQPGKDRPASNCLEELCHLDYKWLLERCDDDSYFVCEVLQTLDQDGSFHVAQIRKALSDQSFHKAVFHAVRPCNVLIFPISLHN